MLGSIRIGSVLGIQVRVHWLFLALVGFLMFLAARKPGGSPLGTLLLIVALFGVVFLHELGHSLVARRFGIRVLDITFWPLGGMARMSEIPEDTKIEGLIAIAGPGVNFVLAFLTAPIWVWSLISLDGGGSQAAQWIFEASSFFLGINLVLGVFNLVPAFPMDGGRVLRALLGRNGDWVGATEKAVKVGRVFAIGMVVLGLMPFTGLSFLPLIGLFVWFAGTRELQAVRARHSAAWNPFGGAFTFGRAPFAGAAPGAPGGPGASARPAATEPVRSSSGPVSDPSGARRPSEQSLDTPLRRRPLTSEDIERLERFHGRLPGFPED